jgi:hypothetical protein
MNMSRLSYNEEFLTGTLKISTEEAIKVCGSCQMPVDNNDLVDQSNRIKPHLSPVTGESCIFGVGHEPAYIPNTPQAREKERSYHQKFKPVSTFK